jgi:hypothetical protein
MNPAKNRLKPISLDGMTVGEALKKPMGTGPYPLVRGA